MPAGLPYILFLFVILAASLISFGLIGYIFFRLFYKYISISGFFSKVLFYVLSGIVLVVSAFSIIKSSGITINTGIVLIALLFFYEFRNYRKKISLPLIINKQIIPEHNFKYKWIFLLTALVFVYLWQAWQLFSFPELSYIPQEKDFVFYSDIAFSLAKTGQENSYTFANFLSKEFHGTVPYHYFELWFSALFISLMGIKAIDAYLLIYYPVFLFLFIVGILSVAEYYNVLIKKNIHLLLLLLFAGGFMITKDLNSDYNFYTTSLETSLLPLLQKMALFFPFAIIAFLFFLNQYLLSGIICLLLISILSSAQLPAITIGLIILGILSFFLFKKEEKIFSYKTIIYSLFVLIYFKFFYSLTGNFGFNYTMNQPLFINTDLSEISFYQVKFMVIELLIRVYKAPVFLLINVVPFILLFAYYFNKHKIEVEYKRVGILILCIVFSGLFISGLFYKIRDSSQFYGNSLYLILVFILILLIKYINEISNYIKYPLMIFLILRMYIYVYNAAEIRTANGKKTPDADFLNNLSQTDIAKENYLGAFIKSDKEYSDFSGKNFRISKLGNNYLPFLNNSLGALDIGVLNIKEWGSGRFEEYEKNVISTSEFYSFTEQQKSIGKFKSIEQSQLDFVLFYKIKFLIVSSGAEIPQVFEQYIGQIITDKKSRERFVLLNT